MNKNTGFVPVTFNMCTCPCNGAVLCDVALKHNGTSKSFWYLQKLECEVLEVSILQIYFLGSYLMHGSCCAGSEVNGERG